MTTYIVNSQVYANPYQRLLYVGLRGRYRLSKGPISKSHAQLDRHGRSIHHIHWEESLFAASGSAAAAAAMRRQYVRELRRFSSQGGKLVWTVHNAVPHESPFIGNFLALREELADVADRILVHDACAVPLLQEQTGLADISKVSVLPHPAYIGAYEPWTRTKALAGLPPDCPRTILYFGMVRAYKGIPEMLRRLPCQFMLQNRLALKIAGKPHRATAFFDDLLTQCMRRPDLGCDFRNVPNNRLPDLLRAGSGLILPYHRTLTSGVAVLALTLGIPTVAADTPAMRSLFPASAHPLLFNPRSGKSLRNAVLELANLTPDVRMQIAQDSLKQVRRRFLPSRISRDLGAIYDELLEVPVAAQAPARPPHRGIHLREIAPPPLRAAA